jgi:outer membrane protein assembly factor BamE
MRLPAILAACFFAAGCSLVYRIDVQQGNYVTEDAVARVKKGMTKAEVRSVLGTPLLIDAFHANQWDYYFSNVRGRKVEETKRFTVMFQDDKVVSFSGTYQPPAALPVLPGAVPQATIRDSSAAPAPAPATPAPAPAAPPK